MNEIKNILYFKLVNHPYASEIKNHDKESMKKNVEINNKMSKCFSNTT